MGCYLWTIRTNFHMVQHVIGTFNYIFKLNKMASFPFLQWFKDPNYHSTCVWHFLIAKEKNETSPYLIIICPNSHEKLTKSEIRSPKYNLCPYLALLTYIYLYLAVFRLNYPYFGISALNCPDFTICAIFTLYMYSSIQTASLCKILEQSNHYSWRYCISKNWGIQKCKCSLGVNLVIDNFCM